MKALLILLLAIGTGYASYQYAYQPLVVEMLGFSKPVPKPPPVVVVEAPKEEAPPPPPVEVKPKPKPVTPEPEVQHAPTVAVTGGLGRESKDPNGFQPPTFQSLEEVTKNWTEFPPNMIAAHYTVKLGKDVSYKMAIGEVAAKAGSSSVVVGQENGQLLVAPSIDAPGRAPIAVDDTDFKTIVRAAYDNYKLVMTAQAKKQWDAAKVAASRPDTFGQRKVMDSGPTHNDKPTRNTDGSYPILMESMRRGEVKEVTPQNIKKWGDAQQENIEGKDYWTVVVSYSTKTMFGDFNVDAQARIYGGKVEKWVYTSSGEPVP